MGKIINIISIVFWMMVFWFISVLSLLIQTHYMKIILSGGTVIHNGMNILCLLIVLFLSTSALIFPMEYFKKATISFLEAKKKE
ncbi:hypothetical protein [Gluconobacter cerinus]|uniref:hypothetical protein n=1 Tax=Gluconobacter cerinus TaxID=38307 RepID=UPI001B8BCDF0|nr:hypothetical protein [Gluconobacter cerinus]MBS1038102.1 hypothetical protein [Gluconobacter cerinus]